MLGVMAVGPLLRWRRDSWGRISRQLALTAVLAVAVLVLLAIMFGMALLPWLGLSFALALGVASFLPLKGRKLTRVPLATWGMVIAHFGIAVSLFGMASESAFSEERLAALREGQQANVGPWQVRLDAVDPIAGPNWTALSGRLQATYNGGPAVEIEPQSRNFWAPPQQTTESVLVTRWNGQLYVVMGGKGLDGRWQLRQGPRRIPACCWPDLR